MITITRHLAREVRAVFRRALNLSARGLLPPVHFEAGSDGLHIRAQTTDAAAEYRAAGEFPEASFAVPFDLLVDCEGRQKDSVTLEPQGKTKVVAQWKDGNIPQLLQYDVPKNCTKSEIPIPPESMASNEPRLLTALRDAMNCVDREAVRYATNCVRIQGGKGRVDATDGRQILVQSGFEFPFAESVLIPWTNAFACHEVTQHESVSIGRTDDWITINTGPWRFHFRINKDGRYPEFDNFLAKPDEAVANCQVSESDADFLAKAIKRLPVDDDLHTPITLDLNGTLAIRASAENQPQPTELVLSNSQVTGEPIRINTNRGYVTRAVQLGFRRFSVYGPEAPVVCHDEARTYVWAVLDKEGAIKPSKHATRIVSADGDSPGKAPEQKTTAPGTSNGKTHTTSRKTSNTKRKTTTAKAPSGRNGQTNSPQGNQTDAVSVDALIAQAETVKNSLRESALQTNDLIAALKRYKKQSKAVQSTLASLRQLQTLEV